jgi:hypothetical protein
MMKQDVPPPKPKSRHDLSAIRAPDEISERVGIIILVRIIFSLEIVLFKPVQLPDTLVPDEYHIVKSRGVWPLKFNDEYRTLDLKKLL